MLDIDDELRTMWMAATAIYADIPVEPTECLDEAQVARIIKGEHIPEQVLGYDFINSFNDHFETDYGHGSLLELELAGMPWSDGFLALVAEYYQEINDEAMSDEDKGAAIVEFLANKGYNPRDYAPQIDYSAILRDLAANTDSPLVYTVISTPDDYDDDYQNPLRDFLFGALGILNLGLSEDEHQDMLDHGPKTYHEAVTVELIYRVDLVQVLDAGRERSVTIINPSVLFVDRWHGLGWETTATGKTNFTIYENGSLTMALDRESRCPWMDISGVAAYHFPEAVVL